MIWQGLLLFCLITPTVWCMHDDKYYPYAPGSFAVDQKILLQSTTPIKPIPFQTRVSSPVAEGGSFPVWYFISGFNGLLPGYFYDDVLTMVASHGVIVVAPWPVNGHQGMNFTAAEHLENVKWLKENLANKIPVNPVWDSFVLGCHSAGCGTTYEMADYDNSLAVGNIFIEPFSMAPAGGVNFKQPALMLNAEFLHSMAGLYYDNWQCPKIFLNIGKVGHCDFLDDVWWNACRILQMFEHGEEEMLKSYRSYIQGMVTAFIQTYVHGHTSSRKYLVDASTFPEPILPLEVVYDWNCRG